MSRDTNALRHAIEDYILTGVVQPGDKLDETRLAAKFGVSRTPIRETLFELAASGLIDQIPRRGAFVAELGPRRLYEMFDVMAELEALCARHAARRMTADDEAAILKAHEACTLAAKANDKAAYLVENDIFHDSISAASHNAFLAEQTYALHRRLKPYRRLQLQARNRMERSLQEHNRIVEAIIAGKSDDAADEMRQHITVQGQRFSDLVASLDTKE